MLNSTSPRFHDSSPAPEQSSNDPFDDVSEAADRAAELRDHAADTRDATERAAEERAGGSNLANKRRRRAARLDRVAAAADRLRASEDRARARTERHAADEVRRSSATDATTGLVRREIGLPALHSLYRRSGPAGRLVVAFVDVDGLKKLNDTRGHRRGDAVLLAVAGSLTDALRSEDVVMRYGGDEFLIGACDMSITDLVSRLTRAALQLQHKHDVDISFGTATVGDHDTLDDAIERADTALYATRNRFRSP